MNCANVMLLYQIIAGALNYKENHNILLAWPECVIICENECDNITSGALWQKSPGWSRLNTTEWTGHWNIYEGASGGEGCAGTKKKKKEDLKFMWGINVKEHSRLSEPYDLCKVYAGSMSLLKGTSKDSEVNRPASSLEGAPAPSTRRCHKC